VTEIDIADLEKLVMLQVYEFIGIFFLPFVKVMHDLLLEPEGRKEFAFLIGF
jgi:hypothetical protein